LSLKIKLSFEICFQHSVILYYNKIKLYKLPCFYVRSYNYIFFLPLVLLCHGIDKCRRQWLWSFLQLEKDPTLYRFYCTKCYYPFPTRLPFQGFFDNDLDNTKFLVEVPHSHCFCENLDPNIPNNFKFNQKIYLLGKHISHVSKKYYNN